MGDSMIGDSMIGDSMIGDSMIGDSMMGDSMMGDSMMGESMIGDESMTNVGDITFEASSKNSKTKPTHKPKQKSRMEEIDETFARLQKEVEAKKHDAETMTEQPTLVNVKTNTNSTADHCNVGTSVDIKYSSFEMMTDDALRQLSEHGAQTQAALSANLEIQTDPIELPQFIDHIEHPEHPEHTELIEQHPEELKHELLDCPTEPSDDAKHSKDDLLTRIDTLDKRLCEHGVQTKTSVVSQAEFLKVTDELARKHSEYTSQAQKLARLLSELSSNKKAVEIKDKTIHEQLEEIEQLSTQIERLENSLSDVSDVRESQQDLLQIQEKKLAHFEQQIKDQEAKIAQLVASEAECKARLQESDDKARDGDSELAEAKRKHEEMAEKYQMAKTEYSKVYKENEKLIEKAATVHMEKDELQQKVQKYKKQLIYLQEEQSKKIESLKDQKINNEMEIIKYQSLLKEKEEFVNKLLQKDFKDSKEIKMIVEENYKKITDYEKAIIQQDHQRILDEQKEKLEKEMAGKKALMDQIEEKYSRAKHKIFELKTEMIKIQKKKSSTEQKKFKEEKSLIIKTLNEKNKVIQKLENEIKEWKVKYNGLENFLGEDQKDNYAKIMTLTKNMSQLKQMYSQMVSAENSKQEKHVLEKKLRRRNAKIKSYEKELSTTREQVVDLKNKIHLLFKEMAEKKKDPNFAHIIPDDLPMSINPDVLGPNKGIVKSRKGGKGSKASNRVSFNQLMAMSSLKNDNDEIKEQDEEDEGSEVLS